MAKRKLLPRPRNGGTMTEAEYFGKIRSILRRGFMYWTPMKKALELRKRKSQSKNRRLLWEYRCDGCKQWFPRKEVDIDHCIPCGSLLKLEDVAQFIANLTPEDESAYQVLCKKKCHQAKTNQERKHGRIKTTNGTGKL